MSFPTPKAEDKTSASPIAGAGKLSPSERVFGLS